MYAQANLSFRCYSADDFADALNGASAPRTANSLGRSTTSASCIKKVKESREATPKLRTGIGWPRRKALRTLSEARRPLLHWSGHTAQLQPGRAWYRRAAEQGNARAQFQLGHLYDVGLGIEHDYTQYRYWTRMAADKATKMPSANSSAAITATHKPTPSRLIAVRQRFTPAESVWRRESPDRVFLNGPRWVDDLGN